MTIKKKTIRTLMLLAKLLYKNKLSETLTYIRQGHLNYFASVLNLIMFFILLGKIVVARIEVPSIYKWALEGVVILTIILVAIVLGWMDRHALITRKIVEKNAYWKRPPWKHVSGTLMRVFTLHGILTIYEAAKKYGGDDVAKELEPCLKEITAETLKWLSSGKDIATYTPKMDYECLNELSKVLANVELSENELNKIKEVVTNYDNL